MLAGFRKIKEKIEQKKLARQQNLDDVNTHGCLTKRNIITTALVFSVILIIVLFIVFQNNEKLNKNGKRVTDPEIARAMTYAQVQEGEDAVEGAENIKFDAFFLRDLDGDGYAESLRGTCKEIGSQDTLYMELNIQTSGYLKDGKITINGKNFYLQTSLPKDQELQTSYIGNNIKEIKFNQLNNGTQKLITGIVRSGDYSYSSGKATAIGNNINNYSQVNSIILSGIYVDEYGNEKPITKEVKLNVDWHRKTAASIYTTNQSGNIQNAIDEEEQVLNLNFSIYTSETTNTSNLKSNHVEGEIPLLAGFAPIDVVYTGSSATFNYDTETRKFTLDREAIVDEDGKITNSISSNNSYGIKAIYPLDAYHALGEDTVYLRVPVSTYYEGFNNTNEEFENPYKSNEAKSTIVCQYRKPSSGNQVYYTSFSIAVGQRLSSPTYRYVISKEKPLRLYNGESEEEVNDTYQVVWEAFLGTNEKLDGVVLKERVTEADIVSDQFMKTNSTNDSMEDITSNVGISFSGLDEFLGEEGWVKVYDDETDELIATFTKENWNGSTYRYETPVKHIRVETSEVMDDELGFKVYNLKEIDDNAVVNKYTQEEFEQLQYIKSTLTGNIVGGLEKSITHYANYEAPFSIADISISKNTISTQSTEKSDRITIKARYASNSNQVKWQNGTFLIKFPKEIIDVKLKNIAINNSQVKLASYEVFEKDGISFIKIVTKNENPEIYDITLDIDISPDPRVATTTKQIELYATNEVGHGYYYRSQDIYDVNNNLNTIEKVNYRTTGISMVSPNSLLTTEIATKYDANNTVVISPQIADIKPVYAVVDQEKEIQTAEIGVQIKNNYASTISDIKILGKIPFEGNTYVISGKDLGSNFTTKMVDTGIEIPEELKEATKVYYSENENPGTDILDESNGWKTADEIENWDNIKTFLIDLNDYVMPTGKEFIFNYNVEIPNGLEFSQTAFSHHGIYFSLDTENGKYKTKTEPNKLGFRIAEKYDLEIAKYQLYQEKLVPGATYSITEIIVDEEGLESDGDSKIGVTNEQGILKVTNVYAEKLYEIREIITPDDYELNTDVVRFIAHVDEQGNMSIEKIFGNTKQDIYVVKNQGENYKVTAEVEDEVKAKIKIIKKEQNQDLLLKGARYKITGPNYDEGRTITTDNNGEAILEGLELGGEYTVEETKAPKGYYLNNEVIKFTIVNEEGEYILTTEGTTKATSVTLDDSIPVINLELEDEKIPTFNLLINKVAKGETTPLPGVKFRLYYGKELWGTYESDENGQILIEDLYRYVAEKEVTQEFTLKEIYAPEGYAKIKDITFSVEKVDETLVLTTDATSVPEQYSEGDLLTITVEDAKSFSLIKIDGETEEVLPGTKFAIYNVEDKKETPAVDSKGNIVGELMEVDGKEYYVVETNENGEISANLPEGLYKAVEIAVCDEKYELGPQKDRSYYFGIGASKKVQFNEEGIYEKFGEQAPYSKNKMVVLENGVTIMTNESNMICAFNKEGEKIWEKILNGTIGKIYKKTEQNVLCVTSGGYIYEISSDGTKENEYKTGYNINSITMLNDNYFIGTSTGLIALDRELNILWKKYSNAYNVISTSDNCIAMIDSNKNIKKLTVDGKEIFSVKTEFEQFDKNEYKMISKDDGNIALASIKNKDAQFLLIDSEGNIVNSTIIGNNDYDGFISIAAIDSGYICIGFSRGITIPAKYTESNEEIIVPYLAKKDSGDLLIVKYNNEGKICWANSYNSELGGHHAGLDIDSNKEYCVIAFSNSDLLTINSESSNDNQEINIMGTENGYSSIKLYTENINIPEQSQVIAKNWRKEFKITTDVEEIDDVKGGTISGEDLIPYETVKYGDSSVEEIKMIPNEGYEVISVTVNGEEYTFTSDEDGNVIMPQFDNVIENKHIVVKFARSSNKMTINKIDSKTGEPIAGVKFKIDQLEEREDPNVSDILGDITGNSSEYRYAKMDNEVTEGIGELTDNSKEYDLPDKENEVVDVLGELTNNGTYYFIEKDGKYIPTNSKTYQTENEGTSGIHNSTANSYIPIDLTGVEENVVVVVNSNVSSEGADYGYATITETTTAPSYNSTTGRFISISGTVSAKEYISTVLEGGKTYYLHLGYRKDGSVDKGSDQIVINSINVYGAKKETYNFIEEDGKYVSTNQGVASTTASSYIPIDLTDKEGEYAVIVNAQISSESSGDYGYATISENTTYTTSNNFMKISGTTSATNYTKFLTGGKIYYLHLGYSKNENIDTSEDKLTINSVKLYEAEIKLFNFEDAEGVYKSTNQGYASTYSRSYIPIDLTGYSGKYNLIVNAEISSQSGKDIGYITTSTTTSQTTSNAFVQISGTQSAKDYTKVLEGGKKYYLHLTYYKDSSTNTGTDTFTINSINLTLNDQDLYHTEVTTNSQGQAIVQVPYGKYQVTEIEAPDDYWMNEEPTIIEFRKDGENEFAIENNRKGKVTVHHYIKGTTTKVAEDEVEYYKPDEKYTTLPKIDLEKYELELDQNGDPIIPSNSYGIFEGEDIEVIYYYVDKYIPLVVQHYIVGTSDPVPLKDGTAAEDEMYKGQEGEEYATSPKEDIDWKYELVEEPENKNGTYEYSDVCVTYYYKLKDYDITTEITEHEEVNQAGETVLVKGGTISGENQQPYENVVIDENSTKDIIVQADEGYKIKSLKVQKIDEDGEMTEQEIELEEDTRTYTLDKFNNVITDIKVIAEFEKVQGTVTVHHYIKDTTTKVPLNDGTEAEDEYSAGYIGDMYVTKAHEDTTARYRLVAEPENASGEYIDGNIEVIYYYEAIPAQVTVHHYIENTTTRLAEDETITGFVKDEYTTSVANVDSKYGLVEVPANANGEMTEDEIIVIYYYRLKDTSVLVHHYIEGTETKLSDDVTLAGRIDDEYKTVVATDIPEKYELVAEPENKNGIMTEEQIVVTYYYRLKDTSVIVHHYIEGTETKLSEDVLIEGRVDDDYTTSEATDIPNKYELVEVPENADGIMTVEQTVVTYYYRLKDTSVLVHHYIEGTETKLADDILTTGQVDDMYVTGVSPDVPSKYEVVAIPENAQGTMTVEQTVVTYYYRLKDTSVLVHHYIKNTETKLSEDVIIDGQVDDEYNTTVANDIPDYYELVEEPENKTGTMVEEQTVVTYYYQLKKYPYVVNYLEIGTNEVLHDHKEGPEYTYGVEINSNTEKITIDGYVFDSLDKEILTITNGENVINIYYRKRNDLSYKVNYLEKDTNKVLHEQKDKDGVTFEQVITSSDEVIEIDGYNYDSVDKETLTITTGENVINIYYTKRNDLSYTVNYLEKDTNKVLHEQKTQEGMTFEDVITSSDEIIEIDGYNYDSVDKDELVITTGENVINIYYVKRNDLSYTVNYLEKDTNKVLKDQKVTDGMTFEDVVLAEDEIVSIYGYDFDSADKETLIITTRDNVINLYYTKKATSVLVHHYAEGTEVKVAEDVLIEGKVSDDYTTTIAEDLPSKYEIATVPANADGTMTEDQIVVIYYYKLKSTKVIVHHYEEGTTNKLSEDVEIEGLIDSEYTTVPADDVPIKYTLVGYPENRTGTMTEEVIEVTYYYAVRDAVLNIYYLEKGTDIELAKPEQQNGKVGENYRTDAKEIEGYTLVEHTGNTTGQLEVEPLTVIYYYLQNTKATVQYIDKTTGEILDERTDTGLVGDEFVTETKTFENYILVEEPEEKTVNMTKDEIVLKYYYIHISGGVIEEHIDVISGDVLYNNAYEGNEGDEYSIPSRTFTGYDLVEDRLPDNAEGTMTVTPIRVTYYYIYRTKVTTKYIDKTTGEPLTEDEIEEGHEGDYYTTENKAFDGYKLVQVPENSNGQMTKEDITVIYYYVPESAEVIERHLDVLTNEEVAPERTYTGYAEDPYETSERQITGYDLVKEKYPENAKGKMTKEEIVVTYYYSRRTQVQVKYVDKITGKEIAEKEIIDGHQGDDYTTEEKEILGYDLIEVPTNKEGTMTDEVIEVIYYYIRPAKVITNYYDIDTKETIAAEEIAEGHENDEYTTVRKEIKYYNLVEVPVNAQGNMTVEDTRVDYYYKKKTFNLKVEKQVKEIAYNNQVLSINGDIGKLEVNKDDVTTANIRITYEIKVKNTGELKGRAELVENIPNGMTMNEADNKDWVIHEDTAILNVEDIEAGQERTYTVVMRWTPLEDNFGIKENIAQIVKVDNEAGFEEITIEDNEDKADLVISIQTGSEDDNTIVKLAILAIFAILGITVTCIIKKDNKK